MVTQQGSGFGLTSSTFSSFDVQTAINYWSGCSGYGPEIPTLEIGGSGNIPVSVVKVSGNSTVSGGGCGGTSLGLTNGQVTSATITIFTKENDGDSCEPLTDVIAHEFGHLLGLTDAPNFACVGHIMGARLAGGTRGVAADDCEVADTTWTTATELFFDPYCEAYCPTFCTGSICEGHPSPILIDLENDGIHLTGLDDPIWFDIDADGFSDLLSWTDRSEGLLALDRNFNGTIDNGGELFGNVTRLSDGTLPLNGYLALAELDSWALGGNRDGHLDASDPAFNSLLLWTDRNHDGISETGELQTVWQARILRIDLDYRRSRRVDSHGNLFAFAGRAWRVGPTGTVRPVLTWDVYFSEAP
ncbi:MAG TPA: hypothetical protein VN851_04305 [Thermoanaerobaculia bacterium]|nr:hypothetical protein [Thermoanaerobaculia bacterium]